MAVEQARWPGEEPGADGALLLRRRRRPGEALIQALLRASGAFSILTTVGIVIILGREALLFFANEAVSLREFLFTASWQPAAGEFGIWPLATATLVTSGIGLLVAVPLGMGVAIYLSEYASARARGILKPLLEILAGIPTVVYGYFALTFVTPLLRGIFGRDAVEIYNLASAGIVIGVLIVPLISSMTEDALSAVPQSLRQAAYGLGATKLETALRIVVPAAASGIGAALIVGMSRAIGETMIVAIAAGSGPRPEGGRAGRGLRTGRLLGRWAGRAGRPRGPGLRTNHWRCCRGNPAPVRVCLPRACRALASWNRAHCAFRVSRSFTSRTFV